MATPPKSRSSKTESRTTRGAGNSPAPRSAAPKAPSTIASQVAVKSRPASAPVKDKPAPVPMKKAPAPSAVETRAEQPAVAAAAESKPVQQVATSEVADTVSLPQSGKTAEAKGEKIMTDVLETAKNYAEETKTHMQSAFTEVNEKAKAAMEKSTKAFEELGELTRGNFEAVVESSRIAAKGVETLGQEAAEFGRKSFEKTSATMKSFASIKTPAEFFQLQSELLSQAMDSFASESARNSEKLLKFANEVSQPISNRASVVADKIKSLAA